ncbi:MAG: Crp/Fnr family transcriptional regulator [Flavobacteriales bacterium]|nr:Crp/Fnr family transcriptional regulator [Flavobacteriales bacterium]
MSATQSKLWYLEKIDLLKGLRPEELQRVADRTTVGHAHKDEHIYFPEEPSNVVFFLKRGRVKIATMGEDGKEVIKAVLYPGEVFGELGAAGEEKRRDHAVALDDDVMICAMNVSDVHEMMNENPHLNLALARVIGERVVSVERRLEGLIFKDSRSRIIDFLKEMAAKHGTQVGHETLLKHALTHQDIADLTATSRQTVTTVLNDLRKKDLAYLERGKLLIRDLKKLK